MDEIQFLKFEDWQNEISKDKSNDLWITVFDNHKDANGYYATFCGIMPNNQQSIQKVLGCVRWEIPLGYGHPGFWKEGFNGKRHYERFCGIKEEMPFEPLIIYRSFHELREEYVELSEEFRLYHNLYQDHRENKFIFFSDSGEEDVVSIIEKVEGGLKVKIKKRYLREFLAAKSMVLVRFHEHVRHSKNDLTGILGNSIINIEKNEIDFYFKIGLNPKSLFNKECVSVFYSKDILLPLPDSLNGKKENRYIDFIIAVDEKGDFKHTCNPDKLSNSFGANPGAPNRLTPVFFKRDVLKEYYDRPSKYVVNDNLILCGNLWSMNYGQNSLSLIHAYLVDLGDLPYNEQLHWKQYNICPEGGLGEGTIKRDFLCEFTEPDEICHTFKYEFDKFSKYWKSKFGWDLFLPLRKDDEHFMKSLHVPTFEEPLEFEQQIQSLAKILSDSINKDQIEKTIGMKEDDIKKLFGLKEADEIRSILWLNAMLVSFFKLDKTTAKGIVKPLKDIQSLRSSGVAHRKGSGYDGIIEKLNPNNDSYINFFKKILENAVNMFGQLQKEIQKI